MLPHRIVSNLPPLASWKRRPLPPNTRFPDRSYYQPHSSLSLTPAHIGVPIGNGHPHLIDAPTVPPRVPGHINFECAPGPQASTSLAPLLSAPTTVMPHPGTCGYAGLCRSCAQALLAQGTRPLAPQRYKPNIIARPAPGSNIQQRFGYHSRATPPRSRPRARCAEHRFAQRMPLFNI